MNLNEEQFLFLEDTRDILIDYDGYRSSDDLMNLIDETKDRLTQLLRELKTTNKEINKIIFNATEIEVGPNLSYEDICILAGYSADTVLSVTYSRGRNKESGMLIKGQSVAVSEGMYVSAFLTNNA